MRFARRGGTSGGLLRARGRPGPAPARPLDPADFAALVGDVLKGDAVTGAALAAWRAGDGLSLAAGAGDMTPDTPYYAASTTKLYLTAVLLQLREEGRIDFDARLPTWLPEARVARLNVRDGTDLSARITLRMLMRQTSGLADYFQHKAGGRTLEDRLIAGQVAPYGVDQALDWARAIGAHHPPGETRKAVYSDTNYQLQGLIIEAVEGAPLAAVLRRRLFDPLGLVNTWLCTDPGDTRPILPRYRSRTVDIRAVAPSFRGDGALVTSANDALGFLRAFFDGRLFPPDRLPPLCDWRRMFFPLDYGTGIERFRLPRLLTGLRKGPDLVGKAGLTGAVLFADLETGICMAGIVNQIRSRRPFRLLLSTVALLR